MSDRAPILFRTDGVWTARDVLRLVGGTTAVYNALLSSHVTSDLERQRLETSMQWHAVDDPQALLRVIRWPDLLADVPDQLEIFRHIDFYVSANAQLTVQSVRMASPGWFSLEGLGGIVEQFRELIRDFWYRNRQERTRGDLEIVRQYLELQRDFPGVPLEPPRYLRKRRMVAELALEGIEELHSLERDGKILELPEHIGDTPAPA